MASREKGTGRYAKGTPARDVAAAGHGKITGATRKPGTASAAAIHALVALAARRRLGLAGGAAAPTPEPSAHLSPSLPAAQAGTNSPVGFAPTGGMAPPSGPPMPMR